MTEGKEIIYSEAASPQDAAAVRHLRQAIASGKHWYLALLEAIGLWASADEYYNDRPYCYLIDGEAFDWLLLAERLCETVNGMVPEGEKNDLLFSGCPPLQLSVDEVKELISESKYRQYLNFFYGVIVEGALLLAVQEEIEKEKRGLGCLGRHDSAEEAHQRIYNAARTLMLKRFRQEKGYAHLKSITVTELKEFSYWLFKYRLKHCEKAKIASDTKKALDFLKQHWRRQGVCGALTGDCGLQ